MTVMNDDLTIVCPAYNNLRHLKNLHASLQRYGNGVKVICIDDASNDGTWAWMNGVKVDDEFDLDGHLNGISIKMKSPKNMQYNESKRIA